MTVERFSVGVVWPKFLRSSLTPAQRPTEHKAHGGDTQHAPAGRKVTGLTASGASTFSVLATDTSSQTCTAVAFSSGGREAVCTRFTVASGLTAGHFGSASAGAGAFLVFTGAEI